MSRDIEGHRESYYRDGFVIVRKFLGESALGELRENLERYIRDVVPGLPDGHAFYDDRSRPETLKQLQHMSGDPFFRDYVRDHRWTTPARDLLGEDVICLSSEWFNKPPGTDHPTPPHQDNYYFNLAPPKVLTIWLALDPVDEENGCLRYVRGSQFDGRRPHAASNVLGFSQGLTDFGLADSDEEHPVLLESGDAAIHHGWTVHRAEANRSLGRHRRSFAMVFQGVSCRRDEDAYRQYQDSLRAQHEKMGLETEA